MAMWSWQQIGHWTFTFANLLLNVKLAADWTLHIHIWYSTLKHSITYQYPLQSLSYQTPLQSMTYHYPLQSIKYNSPLQSITDWILDLHICESAAKCEVGSRLYIGHSYFPTSTEMRKAKFSRLGQFSPRPKSMKLFLFGTKWGPFLDHIVTMYALVLLLDQVELWNFQAWVNMFQGPCL